VSGRQPLQECGQPDAYRKQLESTIEDRRRAMIRTEILFHRYQKAMTRPWVSVEPDSSVKEKYYP
jgi:hypothetical protein